MAWNVIKAKLRYPQNRHTIPSKPSQPSQPSKLSYPQNSQTLKTLKLIYSNEKPLFQLLQISNKNVVTKATYLIG